MHKYINIALTLSLAYSLYFIYSLDRKDKKIVFEESKGSQTDLQTTQETVSETKGCQTDAQIVLETRGSQTGSETTPDSDSDPEYEHLDINSEPQVYEGKMSKSYLQKLFSL